MRIQFFLILLLAAALPALAQTNAENDVPEADQDQWQMMVPPPVSGAAYKITVGADEEANLLTAGLTVSGGYVRNIDPTPGAPVINDGLYIIEPRFVLDRTTELAHASLVYTPSFSWYQPTALSATNQGVEAELQIQLAPHISLEAGEDFLKTSSAFGQVNPSFENPIGGSTNLITPAIIGMFAPVITDRSTAVLSWQFARNDMAAGSGWVDLTDYTNAAAAAGFFNTRTWGGSGSWIHRLDTRQYLGGLLQYTSSHATPATATNPMVTSDGRINNIFAFYTAYLTPNFSISAQGGGQNFSGNENPLYSDYQLWKPGGTASIGWHGYHTALAMDLGRLLSAGQGALGAFETDDAAAHARLRVTDSWAISLQAEYGMLDNVTKTIRPQEIKSGHTISGAASITHDLTRNLELDCSYTRLHQSYGSIAIPALAANPNGDRIMFAVYYHVSRPIGR